jgi:hypothetical protein
MAKMGRMRAKSKAVGREVRRPVLPVLGEAEGSEVEEFGDWEMFALPLRACGEVGRSVTGDWALCLEIGDEVVLAL